VNPAAAAVLGYDELDDLIGRSSHATLQPRHADGSQFPAGESVMLSPLSRAETVRVEYDSLVRADGSMLPVWFSSAPIELPDGRGAVCAFKDASVERATEEQRARRRIIEAGDTARRHLARDLHDGAQQQLVMAVMNLQLAQRKLESDQPESRTLLDTALEQAEAGLNTLRQLVAGIHPAILTHLGLGAAVKALAGRAPLPVRLDLLDQRLEPAVEASVYFFVSEALTNVIKHARASQAAVLISADHGKLVVEVADDGTGGADIAADGVGLPGLADRIGALGGKLTIASPAGQGTTLRAEIPLAAVETG
jgi:signal transduction histidine kinase